MEPLKKIRRTNEMLVKDLMTYSPHGALCRVFIVEAIRYYAEKVSSQPEPAENERALINPKAWHAIAKDVSKRIEENYEDN